MTPALRGLSDPRRTARRAPGRGGTPYRAKAQKPPPVEQRVFPVGVSKLPTPAVSASIGFRARRKAERPVMHPPVPSAGLPYLFQADHPCAAGKRAPAQRRLAVFASVRFPPRPKQRPFRVHDRVGIGPLMQAGLQPEASQAMAPLDKGRLLHSMPPTVLLRMSPGTPLLQKKDPRVAS